MKTFVKAGSVAAVIVVGAPLLFAQWPSFPTPDVPKAADGKPNLSAPAPKMPDGKPDLSGLWENGPLGFGPQEPSPGRRSLRSRHSSMSAPDSKRVYRFAPGRQSSSRNVGRTTPRTIPMRTVCRWGCCSSTSIPSPGRSCRLHA